MFYNFLLVVIGKTGMWITDTVISLALRLFVAVDGYRDPSEVIHQIHPTKEVHKDDAQFGRHETARTWIGGSSLVTLDLANHFVQYSN